MPVSVRRADSISDSHQGKKSNKFDLQFGIKSSNCTYKLCAVLELSLFYITIYKDLVMYRGSSGSCKSWWSLFNYSSAFSSFEEISGVFSRSRPCRMFSLETLNTIEIRAPRMGEVSCYHEIMVRCRKYGCGQWTNPWRKLEIHGRRTHNLYICRCCAEGPLMCRGQEWGEKV